MKLKTAINSIVLAVLATLLVCGLLQQASFRDRDKRNSQPAYYPPAAAPQPVAYTPITVSVPKGGLYYIRLDNFSPSASMHVASSTGVDVYLTDEIGLDHLKNNVQDNYSCKVPSAINATIGCEYQTQYIVLKDSRFALFSKPIVATITGSYLPGSAPSSKIDPLHAIPGDRPHGEDEDDESPNR